MLKTKIVQMYHQNYPNVYTQYFTPLPDMNYNLFDLEPIYTPQITVQNCDYTQFAPIEDETYPSAQQWLQESIVPQSQINIVGAQYATEYEQSSMTSGQQYDENTIGQNNQISRRYVDKFYENSNYNSQITSESTVNSEESNLVEDYTLSDKSELTSKSKNDSSNGSSKENNFGSTDNSLAEGLKENIKDVLIESRLQRFDRLVSAELKRQRDSEHVMLEPVTSNDELIKAVNHLVHAESADMFNGALKAAEEAASKVTPEKAEEAAVTGAREYQAEVTDFINQPVDGWIPIKVIGYVGITRPKLPTKS